ncbi:hypothetical protein CK203_106958 [Vitis vinifera]|uniref:Integrase catalytic domain-containing protein n=1 Tax=Vitis vinifera TaxID=29760 RepID=A0A438FDH3_VITVI|nr:hypothetical protein CK203_106958 [Vitis vinifera]
MHLPLNPALHTTNSNYWVRWEKDPPAADPLQTIQISDESDHLTNVSSLMTQEETQGMQNILRQNHDIFAWAHSDMKGIHPSIASHKLNVFSTARPVRQRIRRFHPERQRVIQNEIDKLLEAGFIREVSYPDWLENIVVIRLWIPLPARDALFLGCLLRISSIPMSPDEEEKTAFITPHGLYCYKVMPFGLKNAGATYQRLMTKIFKPLIGHSVECWQISGFMVSQRGIEVSPDQVKAVMETPPPRNKKELQRLTGKLVALGRFIARFTDELRPFFLAIRKAGAHGPIPKEKLYMYLRYQNGQSAFYSAALTQGAETYLLCQQGIGRRSGVGLLLQSPTGEHLEQAIRLGFSASNNEAEYEAILSGLDLALALSVSKLRIFSDSQLVVKHVQEEYEAKDARMARYLAKKFPPAIPLRQPSGWPRMDDDITEYIRTGTLPGDLKQAHKVRVQAARFTLIGGHLYKRSFTGPYLRCLGHSEAQYVLAELHEGICGNHSGGRSLAHRAHSQGYYWPTMKKDAAAYVKRCDKCQRYAPIPHMPSTTLKSISGPWPFAQWGMDIVGPLPAAPAQKKFLLVATIISEFLFGAEIRNSYSTPRYPQSNGQAEATNKTLITALKKRLEQAKGKWVEELPGVLWAYRTTPGRPTGNTPFALHMEWMQSFLPK